MASCRAVVKPMPSVALVMKTRAPLSESTSSRTASLRHYTVDVVLAQAMSTTTLPTA